jgi:hypothetical protein
LHDRLAPADPARHEAFRRTLREAAEAALDLPEVDPDLPPSASDTPSVDAYLSVACAICGGVCCKPGSTHAFLTPAELAPRLARQPETDPEDVVARYVARLPERSYGGSCVFHGERGCTLDRADRSDICNTYLCKSAVALRDEVERVDPARVHLAAVEGGRVHRGRSVERTRMTVDGGQADPSSHVAVPSRRD